MEMRARNQYLKVLQERYFKAKSGNGKRHRNPPLRVKRLVYFEKSTWIGPREASRKPALEKKSSAWRKKEKESTGTKAIKTHEDRGRRAVSFPSDGIRIRRWPERENWAMVTDPENPFGDLTREEEFRLRELLKGHGNRYLRR